MPALLLYTFLTLFLVLILDHIFNCNKHIRNEVRLNDKKRSVTPKMWVAAAPQALFMHCEQAGCTIRYSDAACGRWEGLDTQTQAWLSY